MSNIYDGALNVNSWWEIAPSQTLGRLLNMLLIVLGITVMKNVHEKFEDFSETQRMS